MWAEAAVAAAAGFAGGDGVQDGAVAAVAGSLDRVEVAPGSKMR
jgi:hypothetical protein